MIEEEVQKSDYPYEMKISYGDQDPNNCSMENIVDRTAIQNSSFCPWYHVQNTSPDRYPESVYEARCRCRHAISLGTKTACELLHYYVKVLRRSDECEDGKYVYTKGWQRIGVGCISTAIL